MTAWAWVKSKWQWLLLGLGLIGVFLAGFFSRRERFLTPSTNVEEKRREIEENAEAKKVEAAEERDEEIRDLQEKHDGAVEGQQQELEDHFEDIKNDPEEVNKWLLEVGKKQR